MSDYRVSFFRAAALVFLAAGSIQASIVSFTTTPFANAGTPTALSNGFASYTGFSLASGNSDTGAAGVGSNGFYIYADNGYNAAGHTYSVNITFTSPVTEFGLDYNYNYDPVSFAGVTLGNGDSFSTTESLSTSGFLGISDPSGTPFTTATLNFSDNFDGSGLLLADFSFADSPASSTPEPASGALMMLGAAAIAGFAMRARKKRKVATL